MRLTADRSVSVLMFSGIIHHHQVHEIEEALENLTKKDRYKVIVDLGSATRISSSALGVLARFAEVCRNKNGELRMVAHEQAILNLLQITMLDKVFDIYRSVEEAEEDF
jgi:anti-sigma B factor antagonist